MSAGPGVGGRVIVGISGSSGAIYGVEYLRRCPAAEKVLILTKWGERVLAEETGLSAADVAKHATAVFQDDDLAAPVSSGSNPFDAFVVVPCSVSTLAKISVGIADSLLTRVAQVALKERRRMVLVPRETPLSTVALENALRLSREGVIVMPASPPFYTRPRSLEDLVAGFVGKLLLATGFPAPPGWRAEDLGSPGSSASPPR